MQRVYEEWSIELFVLWATLGFNALELYNNTAYAPSFTVNSLIVGKLLACSHSSVELICVSIGSSMLLWPGCKIAHAQDSARTIDV